MIIRYLNRNYFTLSYILFYMSIERGRYNNTPLEDRVCTTCDGRLLEDEYHFLMKCSKFTDARQVLFNAVNASCKGFSLLREYDKFVFLLSAGVDITMHTAKFISMCLPWSETWWSRLIHCLYDDVYLLVEIILVHYISLHCHNLSHKYVLKCC